MSTGNPGKAVTPWAPGTGYLKAPGSVFLGRQESAAAHIGGRTLVVEAQGI